MATFTPALAATLARQFITDAPESTEVPLPRIIAAVGPALETFVRDAFNDREKRELFKTEFTGTVATGTLDLSNYLDGTTGRINLKELRQTAIYSGTTPYTWVNSLAQLKYVRPLSTDAPACFLDGKKLRTADTTGSLTGSDTVTFTVTNYPADTTALPKELQGEFVRFLASQFTQ